MPRVHVYVSFVGATLNNLWLMVPHVTRYLIIQYVLYVRMYVHYVHMYVCMYVVLVVHCIYQYVGTAYHVL